MNKSFLKQFEHPGNEYRGAPFWAWNGELDPEELRRQVRIMHKMGLGGFFMHARVGLATQYLGEKWFDCVRASIDEADKLGMRAWLYDEDRWPSGSAGGLVTRNPKYRARYLLMEQLSNPSKLIWSKGTLAAFRLRLKDQTASQVAQIRRGTRPRALARGESILVCSVMLEGPTSWYNGYTYLDTMNPKAVRQFIRVTHEAYKRECGEHFGKLVPGIFTDEPSHSLSHQKRGENGIGMPWTDRLPAEFKKRYGYDILPHLPELLFDIAGQSIARARIDYHDCITQLFVDAFSRQIGKWCDKNGIEFTGHVLGEERLSVQSIFVGSAMRFYEYMQAPGIDVLREVGREYDTAKQVASVARQFGRKWRLSETYGCTGWDFNFEGHKAVSDWQSALGINLRCQHLSYYTMKGEAKRDYPASIFYQSPWWETYPKVEDYFARVNVIATSGEEVRDMLVIHPVESMWALLRKDRKTDPRIKEYDSNFIRLRDTLLGANIDFDFGEEDIMARHARVVRSKGEPRLRVGKADYKVVLVPPMITMRRSTLRLLAAFRKQGGTVIFAGKPPAHVSGILSQAAAALAATCVNAPDSGAALVKAAEPARRLSIADPNGKEILPALYLLREDADAMYLFVCNSGHSKAQLIPNEYDIARVCQRRARFNDVRIRGFEGCTGRPLEFDPDTGTIAEATAVKAGKSWEIRTSLPRLGSRIFVVPKKPGSRYPKAKQLRTVKSTTLRSKLWDISQSENNVLVLDRPRYRIADDAWQAPKEILHVDNIARTALKMQQSAGNMVQPWARKPRSAVKHMPVTLKYRFDADALPSGDLFIALEAPETFTITVNGYPLSMDSEAGWWCDRALRRIPVSPSLLHLRTNELVFHCDYSERHSGLEIVYLLGNFGTRIAGTDVAITAPPRGLKIGDWTRQGLSFYSGSVTYLRKVNVKHSAAERVFLQVPSYKGTAVRITVDGKPAGIIAWEPNEIEITGLLENATGLLGIEVMGHRRNSHGPLHSRQGWLPWAGPDQFRPTGCQWIDGYNVVPCGLLKDPVLVVKK